MGRKSKISKEEKIKVCKDYLCRKRSVQQISSSLDVVESAVRRWIELYKIHGESAFAERPRNSAYTVEFKLQVIEEYLSKKASFPNLCAKYKINDSVVYNWVKMYNSGIELKDYDPKADVYTMKSRKTTLEEKIEIIEYTIENNYDYKGAADKYIVSYANVFNWVKKYEKDKENGLTDKRGRPSILDAKPKELSEVDKLRMELEKEKLKNERLERAIVALKKNEEIRKRLAKDSRKFVK